MCKVKFSEKIWDYNSSFVLNTHNGLKSGHNDVVPFEWRHLWRWTNTKIESYVKIASLKSATMDKLINSLPDITSKPRDGNTNSPKPCLVNLISKDTHLVFSIYKQTMSGLSMIWVKNDQFDIRRGKQLSLTLFRPETPKLGLWQTVKTKCRISSGSVLFAATKSNLRKRVTILLGNYKLWPLNI